MHMVMGLVMDTVMVTVVMNLASRTDGKMSAFCNVVRLDLCNRSKNP